MRRLRVLLGLGILFVGTGVPAEETPSVESLLQRAIDAHGGRPALNDFPHLEMIGTMESFGRAAGRRSESVLRERADGAYRYEVTFEFRGRKVNAIELYDGQVRKRRSFRGWNDLPPIEAEENGAHRLPFLLTVDAAEARFDGEGHEADEPVWLVSVPDGRDRATLFLSRDDGRLVGIEYPATSAEGMGTTEEVSRKLAFRDHRSVGDLLLPFDVEYADDGSPSSRWRFETIEALEAFDPAWLRVPDPTRRFIPSEELVN